MLFLSEIYPQGGQRHPCVSLPNGLVETFLPRFIHEIYFLQHVVRATRAHLKKIKKKLKIGKLKKKRPKKIIFFTTRSRTPIRWSFATVHGTAAYEVYRLRRCIASPELGYPYCYMMSFFVKLIYIFFKEAFVESRAWRIEA